MSIYGVQTLSFPSRHAHSIESIFPIHRPRKLGRVHLSDRTKTFMQILAFVVMEVAFITLAIYAHIKHIPLTIPYPDISTTEAKGALTLLSIVWHVLAVFLVKEIAINIFSAEWMEQVRRSGKLVVGKTDDVSRISAGYLNQIRHFLSPTATPSFRLGFIATLLLLALNAIGPSAITIDLIRLPRSTKIQVANLTLTQTMFSMKDFGADSILDGSGEPIGIAALDRANFVTRFELLEQSIYGFQSKEKNVLMPWPPFEQLKTANETIQYESDVIVYNFSCIWKRPAPFVPDWYKRNGVNFVLWNVSGHTYMQYSPMQPLSQRPFDLTNPAIVPLVTLDPSIGISQAKNPLVTFLFVGSDDTKDVGGLGMSMAGLPTVKMTERSESGNSSFTRVTVLVCDPQFQVKPATILLSDGSLSLADLREGAPTVGNIPVSAANAIFAYSLVGATSFSQQQIYAQLNDISSNLFFQHSTALYTNRRPGSSAQPLPIDDINRNINRALLSSSKAFLSGYNGTKNGSVVLDFALIETSAVGETERLALGGSKPFIIALVVLVGSLVVLAVTIAIIGCDGLHPFDLEHVFSILQLHKEE